MFKISDIERLEKLPSEFDFLAEVDGDIKRISNKNSDDVMKIIIGVDEYNEECWFIKGATFDELGIHFLDQVKPVKCQIVRYAEGRTLVYPAIVEFSYDDNMFSFMYKDRNGTSTGNKYTIGYDGVNLSFLDS